VTSCRKGPLVLATLAIGLTAPAAALGQAVATPQEIGPYDPIGVRAGSFFIFPSLTVSEMYDDNVYAEPEDEDDDLITLVEPVVRIESNFSRHRLAFETGGEVAFHINEEDEDYQDFYGLAEGTLDITRNSNLTGAIETARDHEGRDDVEDEGPAEDLTELWRHQGDLSFFQAFNRLNFRVGGDVERRDYVDEEESDRDVMIYDGIVRTGFFVSPRINTFVQGLYNIQRRDQTPDDDGVDRDSEGWGVSVGAELGFTELLVGELGLGYRWQTFEEDDFDDQSGFGFNGALTWLPTQLTTVSLTAGSDFEPTDTDDAESRYRNYGVLEVDHELLRNVILNGLVAFSRDDFEGIDRADDTLDVGAGVSYLLNRNFSIDGGYTFTKRWSDIETEEFERNRITIGVTARL
jgi:hypothetical protein